MKKILVGLLMLAPVVVVALSTTKHGQGRSLTGEAASTSETPAKPKQVPRQAAFIQGIGFVEPVTEVRRLVFKVNGVIAECRAEVGRTYKKGDVLMELDNREQQAAVVVADAEWAQARAGQAKVLSGTNPHLIESAAQRVVTLKEQDRFWTKEHERYAALASRKAITESEYDKTATEMIQRRAELQRAEAELRHLRHFVRAEDGALAEANVAAAKAKLELRKQEFEATILRAPFDGTVLEVLKREGDGARLLDPEPVAVFGDTSRLRIRAEVDERFVSDVSVGQKAVVFGRGLGAKEYAGRVVLIKSIMGKKTVFSRSATERKDLDVIQVMVEVEENLKAPIGLEVDVKLRVGTAL